MGLEDDEVESSTVCSVNIGTIGQVKCKGTTNVISIGKIVEGTKAKGQEKT